MEQKNEYFANNLCVVANVANKNPKTKPLYTKFASLVSLAAQGRYHTTMALEDNEIVNIINAGFIVRPLGNGEYYVGWYFGENV